RIGGDHRSPVNVGSGTGATMFLIRIGSITAVKVRHLVAIPGADLSQHGLGGGAFTYRRPSAQRGHVVAPLPRVRECEGRPTSERRLGEVAPILCASTQRVLLPSDVPLQDTFGHIIEIVPYLRSVRMRLSADACRILQIAVSPSMATELQDVI